MAKVSENEYIIVNGEKKTIKQWKAEVAAKQKERRGKKRFLDLSKPKKEKKEAKEISIVAEEVEKLLKPITILGMDGAQTEEEINKEREVARAKEDEALQAGIEEIKNAPVHDTGSIWYGIFSFLLPIVGLIAAVIFRKNNYIRNYKMCMKGAKVMLILIAVIILLFLIFLMIARFA